MKTSFLQHAVGIAVLLLALLPNIAQAQDLYVADSSSIVKIASDGTQTTFASGLVPYGIAVDSAGNVYEADYGAESIFKFTPSGTKSTFATGFLNPEGLAFDSTGNLYAVDRVKGSILKFTPSGAETTFARLSSQYGIAIDSAGDVYTSNDINDTGSSNPNLTGTVFETTPNGVTSTFASGLSHPYGLAFDGLGNLYTADSNDGVGYGSIEKITPSGATSTFASGLNYPEAVAFDSAGNLYETDGVTGSILKFAPDGSSTTFATGLDEPGFLAFGPATTPEPSGVAAFGIGASFLLAARRRKRK